MTCSSLKSITESRKLFFDRKWLLFLGGVVLFLFLSFFIYILRNYYIKAYSDPLNWLEYARAIPLRFRESSWPVGYPFFLWVTLKVVGPFYIFLVNLPIII
ncbi:hypothetical protein ACFLS1_11800, partial [Verrucomicrobiota bacterium]